MMNKELTFITFINGEQSTYHLSTDDKEIKFNTRNKYRWNMSIETMVSHTLSPHPQSFQLTTVIKT